VENRDSSLFDDYSSPHLSLGLVRIERQVTSSSSLSAYVGRFRQDDAQFPSASGNERRDLVEVRYTGVSGRVDWDAEAMSQNGSIGAQSVRAWATGAVTGQTFSSTRFRPRISVQFDAASGDKSPTDHQLNTFNPLFPSGSYFTTAGYTTYANLVHVKIDLSLSPLTNVKLSSGIGVEWRETIVDVIYTLPDVPVPDTAGRGGRYVGTYAQFRSKSYILRPALLSFPRAVTTLIISVSKCDMAGEQGSETSCPAIVYPPSKAIHEGETSDQPPD
jgi:Alginate export